MSKKPAKPAKDGKREPKYPSINSAYNQIKDRKAANKKALEELDN